MQAETGRVEIENDPSRLTVISFSLTMVPCSRLTLIKEELSMAYEFYVTIEGAKQGKFKGDGRSKAHKDQITGLAFDYEVISSRDPASGQATGKRQHKPVTITKRWGAATPQLFQALITNEVLTSVRIEFVKTSSAGKEYVYHKIKLTDATISDIHQHAAAETRELEEVSFTFRKIEIENVDGRTAATDDWSSGPA